MEWEGWLGRRVLARCWEHRSWRWSLTGRILDSAWRCDSEDLLWTPRQILRAEFWTVWSFWTLEGEILGNQTGAAYVRMGLISAL